MLDFKSITPRSPESAVIKPNTSASLRHIFDSGNIKQNCFKMWLKRARLTALMMLKLKDECLGCL